MRNETTSVDAARLMARALYRSIDTRRKGRKIVARLRYYKRRFPDDAEIVISYGLAMERLRSKIGMLDLWKEIASNFPADLRAQRMLIRWMTRSGQHDAASAKVHEFRSSRTSSLEDRLQHVSLLGELRSADDPIAALQQLARDFDGDTKVLLQLARSLAAVGRHDEAWNTIAPILENPAAPRAITAFAAGLRKGLDAFYSLEATEVEEDATVAALALAKAIRLFKDRAPVQRGSSSTRNITLVTGSIGPGGAERQLVNCAILLNQRRQHAAAVQKPSPVGEVKVLVRSCSWEGEDNFYYRELREEGVSVSQMADVAPVPALPSMAHREVLESLFRLLPSPVIYGTMRCITYFKNNPTDIAYIWQDGAILTSVLGALISGIDRLILSLRGMPTNIRQHLHRPEYLSMFKALAAVPGITFVANSRAGADAYADWLGIARDRIEVIHNGVDVLPITATFKEQARWSAFARRTTDVSTTICGVFTHKIDKRPLLWVEMAKCYLEYDENARFILVGSGPLLSQVRELIQRYAIGHRILLTGLSRNVGFWLSRTDVCVLLSKYEGLPNVLLEAQALGVPVVSTPAGGASETVIEGETGFITSNLEDVDLAEAVQQIATAAGWIHCRPELRKIIKTSVLSRFSYELATDKVELFLAQMIE